MDEPTAHLDAVSEVGIIEVIRRLATSATTIVASYSPAVLAACDRMIELDRGRLIGGRSDADGHVVPPPITRISLEEARAALSSVRPGSGKTVITL